MSDPVDQEDFSSFEPTQPPPAPARAAPRDRIIDALLELAAERDWSDFGIPEIAARAGVTLSEFRDAFPSKGAVLAGFSRRIDKIVLDGTTEDLRDEPAKERLFDVLMRRLDAMHPYKAGLEGVAEWAHGEPLAAAALNGVALNAMRFMLVAAGIDTESRTASLKLQGLVLAWTRILTVWFEDEEAGLARTMAALDRELERGATLAGRIDDLDRLASPVRLLGRALLDSRRRRRERKRQADRTVATDEPLSPLDPAAQI